MKGILARDTKYRKVVDAIFSDQGTVVQHAIPNLLHYSLMTPNKLPKIGKYVAKRAKDGLAKKRYGFVEVSMTIFNELTKACHADLALFAPHVREMLNILLNSPNVELKAMATDTFVKFAEHANANEIEPFLNIFFEMSVNNSNDETVTKQTRLYGLRGILGFIGMTDDLDSFIAKYIAEDTSQINEPKKFISIILDNMQFKAQGEPELQEISTLDIEEEAQLDWQKSSIRKTALCCLKVLASRVNNITIRPLFESILSYIDRNGMWQNSQFPNSSIKALVEVMPSQLHQTVIRYLLQHLEKVGVKEASTKTKIINCIIYITPSTINQPMVEILAVLLSNLSSNLMIDKDQGFESAVKKCISKIADSISDPLQRIDAVSYFISRMHESNSLNFKLVISKIVLSIAEQFKPLSSNKQFPSGVLVKISNFVTTQEPKVRLLMLQSLRHFIQKCGLLQIISQANYRASMFINPVETAFSQIRSNLLTQTLSQTNTPAHFLEIHLIHSSMLLNFKNTEVISLVPQIFEMQQSLIDEKNRIARSIHALIASLFMKIAVEYKSKDLENYVKQILSERKKSNQLCKYLEVKENGDVSLSSKNYRNNKKDDVKQVTVLFDKEKIVGFISEIKTLNLQYNNALPQLLQQATVRSAEPLILTTRSERSRSVDVAPLLVDSFDNQKKVFKDDWSFDSFYSLLDSTTSPSVSSNIGYAPHEDLLPKLIALDKKKQEIDNQIKEIIEIEGLDDKEALSVPSSSSILLMKFPQLAYAV